jgi:membrane protein DedA with SNARE-associated domain
LRKALLVAAVVRAGLSILAIPLAPFLYREHAAVLILLRPTKETLLFAGYAVHHGDVALPVAVAAALPMLLLGVWQFFAMGRLYRAEMQRKDLPGIAGRVLPRKRVRRLQGALKQQGDKVVFLGRLAAMPSSLIAAAAGSSGYNWRRFLVIDGCGALVSLALMLGLGWLLEDAYEQAGPWLTGLGIVALAAGAVIVGRALTRGEEAPPATRASASTRRNGSGRRTSRRRRPAAAGRRG